VPDQRPKWTRHIVEAFDEALDDASYPIDGSADDLHDEVEHAVLDIFCRAYGHDIIDDQCMIPDHRFCIYCNRRASDL
jgi:hypothetical protein